jgi:hypothetical protein
MKISSQESQVILSLEKAKQFARVSQDVDDSLIESLIDAAIAKGEQVTGKSLVEKECIVEVTNIDSTIVLPVPPIASVDTVEYWDGEDWTELVEEDDYYVFGVDELMVSGVSLAYQRLRITFTTSYLNNADINRLLYELIAVWYDNRPDGDEMEQKVVNKLARYKRWTAE